MPKLSAKNLLELTQQLKPLRALQLTTSYHSQPLSYTYLIDITMQALSSETLRCATDQLLKKEVAKALEKLIENLNNYPLNSLTSIELSTLLEGYFIEQQLLQAAKFLLQVKNSVNPTDAIGLPEIIKRDGQTAIWDLSKIITAIGKTFIELGQPSAKALPIAQQVETIVREQKRTHIHIEEIQDIVQVVLMSAQQFKVAEAYLLFRRSRERERNVRSIPNRY